VPGVLDRFDPATNTWSSVSVPHATSIRANNCVWMMQTVPQRCRPRKWPGTRPRQLAPQLLLKPLLTKEEERCAF
jgi:hypothetical protein